MIIKTLREDYYWFSGKTSDVTRQLSFAGIAIIWIFKTMDATVILLPKEFILPLFWFVISLASDLLQYVSSTIIWGVLHRHIEIKKIPEDENFEVNQYLNWPSIGFFWVKVLSVCIGYLLIIIYLFENTSFQ